MNINLILNKVVIKIPKLKNIISEISFEKHQNSNKVAFIQGKKIFYTDGLFTNYNDEEQAFIIAHEIMHYINHRNDSKKYQEKYQETFDSDLANFVEDAQINQILIKLKFIPIKDCVLLEDALNYKFEELYIKLFPITKELLYNSNFSKYTSVADILDNMEFFGYNNQNFKK